MEYCTWMNFDDVTTALCALAATPGTVPSKIAKFWSNLLYDRTSSQESGTQTAVHPERSSYRWTPPPPPTTTHTSSINTAHKEGCLPSWSLLGTGDGCSPGPELPSPSDWGWKTGGWEVNWTTLPEAAQASRELLKDGVQQGKMQMCQGITSVSALCHCGGLCSHN